MLCLNHTGNTESNKLKQHFLHNGAVLKKLEKIKEKFANWQSVFKSLGQSHSASYFWESDPSPIYNLSTVALSWKQNVRGRRRSVERIISVYKMSVLLVETRLWVPRFCCFGWKCHGAPTVSSSLSLVLLEMLLFKKSHVAENMFIPIRVKFSQSILSKRTGSCNVALKTTSACRGLCVLASVFLKSVLHFNRCFFSRMGDECSP